MLNRYLRSPTGIMALIGCTYLAAVVLAFIAVAKRNFFEGYVREKYAAPAERIVEIGRQLAQGTNGVARVQNLPALDQAALYEAWMQGGETWPSNAPAAMMRAAPQCYLKRAHQTMLCGSVEQRGKVVGFLQMSAHPESVALLEQMLDRAQARNEAALAETVKKALGACRRGTR
jgi:hypothetical protein